MDPPCALIVMTTCPDAGSARRIARVLVERRLAACVNVLAPVWSVYRWSDAIEDATEVPILIKTGRDRYDEIEAEIRRMHPYQLPEIIAIPLAAGFSPYLAWIQSEASGELPGSSMQNSHKPDE